MNRTLVFIQKSFEGNLPYGKYDPSIESILIKLYESVGELIESGNFKEALELIFEKIRYFNKFFDEAQPWISIKKDLEKCKNTLYTCTVIIANLSILLEPFLPFSSRKIKDWLSIDNTSWEFKILKQGLSIKPSEILFNRIDKKVIDEEVSLLKNQ